MHEPSKIKKNYESYDDERIKRIASEGARGLREEVVPLLIAEIEKRNLGDELIKWITSVQNVC